jgi:hypothetical protein
MVRKKNDSIYSGSFDSASKQIASGKDAYVVEQDGIRGSVSDSGVIRAEIYGSTITVDPRTHLISLNGAPPQELNKAPELADTFRNFSGGAVDFGMKREQKGLTIHETFAATTLDTGDAKLLLIKTGPLSFAPTLSVGGALYGGEELNLPAPRYDALVKPATEATSTRS